MCYTELLQLFCDPHILPENSEVQVHHIRDELLDEVIGLDVSKLQHLFTEEAWLLVNEKSKAIELHSASYNIMPLFS